MTHVQPLDGSDLLVLFVQLAVLLLAGRLLGEMARRLRQPAVVGELLAGVLLGPTLLGHFAPGLFESIFPAVQQSYSLLEAVAWIGLVLLLLLTGFEIDVSHFRRIGKAAFLVSAFGLLVPFASGWGLGWMLPDEFLTDATRRPTFALFMATAMAISALPVIAKILMDLDVVKRNLGILTLSAAVVDDTVGWLVLSVIAGIARQGRFSFERLGMTLVLLAVFLAVALMILKPLLQRLFRVAEARFPGAEAEITLIVVCTLLMAAVTERIGVHAALGAFVAGVLLRQMPRLRQEALQAVEHFVFAVLAPIFFAYVGLRVDLWTLSGWMIPALVLFVAVSGKLAGCEIGGRLAGLPATERLAVGIAMTARGAMELVVALIGLSLGLLTPEIYSAIVMMAVLTSVFASLALPVVIARIPLADDERRRLEEGELRRIFRATGARLLLPTAGGPHAEAAFRLGAPMAARDSGGLTVFHAETGTRRPPGNWLRFGALRRRDRPGTPIDEHQLRLRELAEPYGLRFQWKSTVARRTGAAILEEAARGYDVVLIGASGSPEGLQNPVLREILAQAPAHLVIVRGSSQRHDRGYRKVLVPTDGSFFARAALEFAVLAAEPESSRIIAFHVLPASDEARDTEARAQRIRDAVRGAVLGPGRKPVTSFTDVPVEVRLSRSDRPGEAIVREAGEAGYDLIVLGAENKTLSRLVFYGQGTQYVLENSPCDVAVVIPRL